MTTDVRPATRPSASLAVTAWALRLVTAGGLAVDAWVHFDLAPTYDAVRSNTISQGDLFRVEGVAAVAAAVLVLVWGRLLVALGAVAVAGGGLVALLAYRYVDVGAIGPLPNMYEPAWYTEKWVTTVAQAVAAVAAAGVALLALHRTRSARQPVE